MNTLQKQRKDHAVHIGKINVYTIFRLLYLVCLQKNIIINLEFGFGFGNSEGCLACITAYLVYLCTETHYEKVNNLIHNVIKISQINSIFSSSFFCWLVGIPMCIVYPESVQVYCPTE